MMPSEAQQKVASSISATSSSNSHLLRAVALGEVVDETRATAGGVDPHADIGINFIMP